MYVYWYCSFEKESFCTLLDVSGRMSLEICVGNGWEGRITVIKVVTPGRGIVSKY